MPQTPPTGPPNWSVYFATAAPFFPPSSFVCYAPLRLPHFAFNSVVLAAGSAFTKLPIGATDLTFNANMNKSTTSFQDSSYIAQTKSARGDWSETQHHC